MSGGRKVAQPVQAAAAAKGARAKAALKTAPPKAAPAKAAKVRKTVVAAATHNPEFDFETNGLWAAAKPTLSVLTPFLGDDPTGLIRAIEAQAAKHGLPVELIVLDDGTNDPRLRAAVSKAVQDAPMPAAFIVRHRNAGRAAARNLLAEKSRGGYLLFNDADCLPDRLDFLLTYLKLIEAEHPAFVVGGFSLQQASLEPQFALHRHITSRRDCLPASERQKTPWRYAYGSNILVRREVMEATPFNVKYLGWGWEDQEWAMRVAKRWPIRHVDNTVSHMGLDDVDVLFRKYASSGENYRLITSEHPELLKTYPAFRAAGLLKNMPARGLWKALSKGVARSALLPMDMRVLGLRLFRALHYGDV